MSVNEAVNEAVSAFDLACRSGKLVDWPHSCPLLLWRLKLYGDQSFSHTLLFIIKSASGTEAISELVQSLTGCNATSDGLDFFAQRLAALSDVLELPWSQDELRTPAYALTQRRCCYRIMQTEGAGVCSRLAVAMAGGEHRLLEERQASEQSAADVAAVPFLSAMLGSFATILLLALAFTLWCSDWWRR